MANDFAITAATDEVALDGRTGTASFTVANASGEAHRVVAVVRPEEADQASWYRVEPPVERRLDRHEASTFTVGVEVPAGAEPGTHRFRLRVHTAEGDPHEVWADGPDVAVTVPEPTDDEGGDRFPWWVVAVGAVAVLVLGVLGVLVFGGDDDDDGVVAIREDLAALTAARSADLDPIDLAEDQLDPFPGEIASEVLAEDSAGEQLAVLERRSEALAEAVDDLIAAPDGGTTTPRDDLGFEPVSIDRHLVGRNGVRMVLLDERSPEACLDASPDATRVDLFEAAGAPAVCVATTEGNRALITSIRRDFIAGSEVVVVAFRTFEAR